MKVKNRNCAFIIFHLVVLVTLLSNLRADDYGYLYIEVDPADSQIQIDENLKRAQKQQPRPIQSRQLLDEVPTVGDPVPLVLPASEGNDQISIRTTADFAVGNRIRILQQARAGSPRRYSDHTVIRIGKVNLIPTLFIRPSLAFNFQVGRRGEVSDPGTARVFKIQPPSTGRVIAVPVVPPANLVGVAKAVSSRLVKDVRSGENELYVASILGFDPGDIITVKQEIGTNIFIEKPLPEIESVTELGNKIVLKEPMRNNYLLRDGKVTIYHSLKIEWRVDFPKESHILIQEIDHTGFSLGLLKDAQSGDLELFVSSTFELGPGDVISIEEGVKREDPLPEIESVSYQINKITLKYPLKNTYAKGKTKLFRIKISEVAEVQEPQLVQSSRGEKQTRLILKDSLRRSFSNAAQVYRLSKITISKSFYLPEQRIALIQAGEVTKFPPLSLKRGRGSITILSDPANAVIKIEPQFTDSSTELEKLATPPVLLIRDAQVGSSHLILKTIRIFEIGDKIWVQSRGSDGLVDVRSDHKITGIESVQDRLVPPVLIATQASKGSAQLLVNSDATLFAGDQVILQRQDENGQISEQTDHEIVQTEIVEDGLRVTITPVIGSQIQAESASIQVKPGFMRALTISPPLSETFLVGRSEVLEKPYLTPTTIRDIPAGEYQLKIDTGKYMIEETPVTIEADVETQVKEFEILQHVTGDLLTSLRQKGIQWSSNLKVKTITPSDHWSVKDLDSGRDYSLHRLGDDKIRVSPITVLVGQTTFVNRNLRVDQKAPIIHKFEINDRLPTTKSPRIKLTFSVTDTSGVYQMAISNTGEFEEWQPYTPTLEWQVESAPGTKEIHAKFKDRAGNESPVEVRKIGLNSPLSMIYIPDTKIPFMMGNENGAPDEKPEHLVTLSSYYIDQYEVTNAEYKDFVDATDHPPPSHWDGLQYPKGMARFPVANVSWEDANAYAKWVGKRLPTEAEWERAALGGSSGMKIRPKWAWGDRWNGLITNLVSIETGAGLAPVDRFPNGRTQNGIYNMCGNAWEWVSDWYDPIYYAKSGISFNPEGPSESTRQKVVRGGIAVGEDGSMTAITNREKAAAEIGYPGIGFRCVRSIE